MREVSRTGVLCILLEDQGHRLDSSLGSLLNGKELRVPLRHQVRNERHIRFMTNNHNSNAGEAPFEQTAQSTCPQIESTPATVPWQASRACATGVQQTSHQKPIVPVDEMGNSLPKKVFFSGAQSEVGSAGGWLYAGVLGGSA